MKAVFFASEASKCLWVEESLASIMSIECSQSTPGSEEQWPRPQTSGTRAAGQTRQAVAGEQSQATRWKLNTHSAGAVRLSKGGTVDPRTIWPWTTWVHLYVDHFDKYRTVLCMCFPYDFLTSIFLSPAYLIVMRYRIQRTKYVLISQLLVVKSGGWSKGTGGFLTIWGISTPTRMLLKVNCISYGFQASGLRSTSLKGWLELCFQYWYVPGIKEHRKQIKLPVNKQLGKESLTKDTYPCALWDHGGIFVTNNVPGCSNDVSLLAWDWNFYSLWSLWPNSTPSPLLPL